MDYFDRLMGDYDDKDLPEKKIIFEKKETEYNNAASDNNISSEKLNDFYSENSFNETATKSRFKWNLLFSLFVIFVLIPLTFILSIKAGDRRLYFGSIIIMILAMLPFFVNFESKKPNARELVTLAVLTAIAVISRIAFMWLPAFVPMAGFIAITGMNYGPQAGFMCGSLSMIVSNIVFGQGTWTPWQMFCYGMVGFVVGLLARPGIMSEKHCIRSGIITFFIVTVLSSIVLDSSTLFFMFNKISKSSILAVYIAGLPYNVLNGLSSGLAVALLSKPISIIINRIKLKYGLKNDF